MARKETSIKLELRGSRAPRGIGLTDLESFIESSARTPKKHS